MHALVTGGNGFLGRYIVEQLLARGDRVRSFGRSAQPELKSLGVEVVRGDIRDKHEITEACRGIDCVFHTAALAGIGMRWGDFYETNLVGTKNVLTGCRIHAVDRLVYTSSPSVVFQGADQTGIDETTVYGIAWLAKHRCHYSHSKALAESAVLTASRCKDRVQPLIADSLSRTDWINACALRPHLIWGPRDAHLIPRLIARAKKGRLRQVGDGTNLVDMTYVENAARAHLQAADALIDAKSPVAGQAYFLSQGVPVNCWNWINDILELAELPPVKKSVSLQTAWRIGSLCEQVFRLLRLGGEPPMTRFLAAQLATSHWFDISAARRDFGYEPRIGTAEGMQRLWQWLSSEAAGAKR
ncbi:MAG: NAD-dependent epimerase/dehydratase family protein [Planctomycetales bacterium]|nr:NAD-dependent epimerase/dehydratase family protein [Planctomycetales bacterium]